MKRTARQKFKGKVQKVKGYIFAFFILPFALLLAPHVWALGGVNSSAGEPASGAAPGSTVSVSLTPVPILALEPDRYSALAGVELLRMGGASQVLPALAVRYRLERPWLTALEIGGTIPTDMSSGFHQNSFTYEYSIPRTVTKARIDSMAEAHVAGVLGILQNRPVRSRILCGCLCGEFFQRGNSRFYECLQGDQFTDHSFPRSPSWAARSQSPQVWRFMRISAMSATTTISPISTPILSISSSARSRCAPSSPSVSRGWR